MQNPYTSSSSELYYGRESLFRSLLQDERQSQSVVLIGGRRCGKTRTLERVSAFLETAALGGDTARAWSQAVPDHVGDAPDSERVHWPIHLNLQGTRFESLEAFLLFLLEKVRRSLHEKLRIDVPEFRALASQDNLRRWLDDVDGRLANRALGGIALLFDEVENLFQFSWSHDFMSLVRSLDDGELRSRLWFVMAGSDALDRYIHPGDGSQPLNTSRRTRIADLDYASRRRLATEPFVAAGRLPLRDDVLVEVDVLAGGHVWILTRTLELLFSRGEDTESLTEAQQNDLLTHHYSDCERWSQALDDDDDVTWPLYEKICAAGRLGPREVQGPERMSLEVLLGHSLVHRGEDQRVEIGPKLFYDWAREHQKVKLPLAEHTRSVEPSHLLPGRYRFDVGLSFAGPQREVAEDISKHLRGFGREVFFDQELTHEMWGENLGSFLPACYDRRCRCCVLLVSADYVDRPFPVLEAESAVRRAMRDGRDAVLVVSLDGTRLSRDDVDDRFVLDVQDAADPAQYVATTVEKRLKSRNRK